jgi:hypothetical protein
VFGLKAIIPIAALLAATSAQAAPLNLKCSYRVEVAGLPPDKRTTTGSAVLDLDQRIFITPDGEAVPLTEVTETKISLRDPTGRKEGQIDRVTGHFHLFSQWGPKSPQSWISYDGTCVPAQKLF